MTMTEASQASQANKRPRPTYAAEKVSELPDDLKLNGGQSGPRTNPALVEALQVAQSDPGEFYCVGVFQSMNGARTMLKNIKNGKVTVPSGDWDFEARRVLAPGASTDDDKPVRWSKLYAKFLG